MKPFFAYLLFTLIVAFSHLNHAIAEDTSSATYEAYFWMDGFSHLGGNFPESHLPISAQSAAEFRAALKAGFDQGFD
jgi:hypothetical protein